MNNRIKLFYLFVFVMVFAVTPFALSAQAEDAVSLDDAVTKVRAEYADDTIREIWLDDEFDRCWNFELESGLEVCVSLEDGSLIVYDDLDMDMDDVSGTDGENEVDIDMDDEDFDDEDFDDKITDLIITIALEEAIEEALRIYPDAEIISIELEIGYDGLGVWDIELGSGQEVDISIESGNVLGFGYSDEDDDVEPHGGDVYYDDEDFDDEFYYEGDFDDEDFDDEFYYECDFEDECDDEFFDDEDFDDEDFDDEFYYECDFEDECDDEFFDDEYDFEDDEVFDDEFPDEDDFDEEFGDEFDDEDFDDED